MCTTKGPQATFPLGNVGNTVKTYEPQPAVPQITTGSRFFQDTSKPEPVPPKKTQDLIKLIMAREITSVFELAESIAAKDKNLLNAIRSENGLTPLIAAISRLDDATTNLLIRLGADVNLASFQHTMGGKKELFTPALMAVAYSYITSIELMLNRADFNINLKTKEIGLTVIFYAIQQRELEIVNYLLLKKRAGLELYINIQALDGSTPLHMAVFNDLPDIVETLLSFPDIDANLRLRNGLNAIQIAIKYKKYTIAEILLNCGKVDIFSTGNREKSAFQYLEKYDDSRMKEIFSTFIQENFLIPYSNSYMSAITELNLRPDDKDRCLLLPKKEQIGDFPFLQQLLTKKPDIESIHISTDPYLCSEDSEHKIFLMRLTNSRLIIEVFDFKIYENYMLVNHKCPVTQMPLSTNLDYENTKCYLLKKSDLTELEKLL